MQDSTFIGLDVHKATISVAVARGERGGPPLSGYLSLLVILEL